MRSPDDDGAAEIRRRLRDALRGAMRSRDTAAVSVLRSALAALDNAEAVAAPATSSAATEHPDVAGSVAGLHATETPRRHLTEAEATAILQAEITDRHTSAETYARAGHVAHAERLRHEANVLGARLVGPDATPAAGQVGFGNVDPAASTPAGDRDHG